MKSKTLMGGSKAIIAGIIAAAMVLSLSVTGALAYFTTYAQAVGGHEITLGNSTEIHEEFSAMKKSVSIENKGDNPCFVRIQVSGADGRVAEITGDDWYYGDANGNAGYTGTDGWWYYNKILEGKSKSSVITVKINEPGENNEAPFDVVVIHESTLISNADGTAGVWNLPSDTAKN